MRLLVRLTNDVVNRIAQSHAMKYARPRERSAEGGYPEDPTGGHMNTPQTSQDLVKVFKFRMVRMSLGPKIPSLTVPIDILHVCGT